MINNLKCFLHHLLYFLLGRQFCVISFICLCLIHEHEQMNATIQQLYIVPLLNAKIILNIGNKMMNDIPSLPSRNFGLVETDKSIYD